MSKTIGRKIPDQVLDAFNGEQLESKVGLAYMLLTLDADLTPRPCMLSAGEILAVSDACLRFALWRGTRTSANLARGGPAVFCYVAPRTVFYLSGKAKKLGEAREAGAELFELVVENVDSDEHAGMPVTDTIRFEAESPPLDEVLREWYARLEVLRNARDAAS